MRRIQIVLFTLIFSTVIQTLNAGQHKPEIWTVYFENVKGMEVTGYCEVARSEAEKRRGLMFRDKLSPDECMIFIYEEPVILSFWMKNTNIPLSIAFLDERRKIIEIYDMKPHDENIITSTLPGKYAIETNRGWFNRNYIFQGAKTRFVKRDVRVENP